MDKFPGGDANAYKEWMRNRLKYEEWENSLLLYKMKEKEGNTAQCKKIIDNLNEKFGLTPQPTSTPTPTANNNTATKKQEKDKTPVTAKPDTKQTKPPNTANNTAKSPQRPKPKAAGWTKGKS